MVDLAGVRSTAMLEFDFDPTAAANDVVTNFLAAHRLLASCGPTLDAPFHQGFALFSEWSVAEQGSASGISGT